MWMVTEPRTVPKGGFLNERARDVFEDLGYDVSPMEGTLRAERGDKVVEVAVITDDDYELCPIQWEDNKYCFVLDADEAENHRDTLRELAPPGSDWAVIGVEPDDYEVY